MNRPTNELEDLLLCADEAMADGAYEEAVVILRQAANQAPLRRDVRNKLALALEGTPAQPSGRAKSAQRGRAVSQPSEPAYEDSVPGYDLAEPDDDVISTEQISEAARKAFRAAADTTTRASVATRNLTNLLQNGIQNWKSSLMEQLHPVRPDARAGQTDPGSMAGSSESELFTSSAELDSLISERPSSSTTTYIPPAPSLPEIEEESIELPEMQQMSKPAPASRKTASSRRKSTSRPTDVEDVLAAGIGSLLESASRVDKKKVAYAGVYTVMVFFLTLACYDASKKFPGVKAVPLMRDVVAANVGGLDLSGISTTPVIEARNLAAAGKNMEAIALLKARLGDGQLHPISDPIRVELAAHLNAAAEQKLRANQLRDSANLYREAVGVMPGDSGLSLRLSNALYYLATMGEVTAGDRKSLIKEALDGLAALVSRGSDNVQVYRLRALLQEADGDKNQAATSWQKVKAMAAENSPEHAEALTHLK